MPTLTFRPKQITKRILSPLNDRSADVLSRRFGLDGDRITLEAIGQSYGITRERVRQIENAALTAIRKSEMFEEAKVHLAELEQILHDLGGVVVEDDFLAHISSDPITQNHINLYLVLGDQFTNHKESDHFHTRWSVRDDIAREVEVALHKLYSDLSTEDLVPEQDVLAQFGKCLGNCSRELVNEARARRWLATAKRIASNPLGEWGRAESPNVKTRGIRDYAFLAMRDHGSPMHFREVADAIGKTFDREAHAATCHNELIKDPRFILVGRGMYALKNWGYKEGVARDVIKDILKAHGPLTRDEIVDKVMKERYFKKNTIIVNLHNPKYFKKGKDGKYTIVK